MPVIVLEAGDFTSPLSLARTSALLSGCLTFSLAATLDPSQLSAHPQRPTFWLLCMFTWCLFFVLTLLIHVLNVIQFHSLVPVSWKNLTVTVAALAALMALSASVSLPWMVLRQPGGGWGARPVAASLASCLTFLAYASEAVVIRAQSREQRGYMASAPGLLKVLQFWGGCQMVPLLVEEGACRDLGSQGWQLWASAAAYGVCLLMSLGTVAVVLGDCAGRCPLPFDRLLAAFSLAGVLLYVVATVLCFNRFLSAWPCGEGCGPCSELVVMESAVASVTLLAYTVDLAFSIKLLRDRSHS